MSTLETKLANQKYKECELDELIDIIEEISEYIQEKEANEINEDFEDIIREITDNPKFSELPPEMVSEWAENLEKAGYTDLSETVQQAEENYAKAEYYQNYCLSLAEAELANPLQAEGISPWGDYAVRMADMQVSEKSIKEKKEKKKSSATEKGRNNIFSAGNGNELKPSKPRRKK